MMTQRNHNFNLKASLRKLLLGLALKEAEAICFFKDLMMGKLTDTQAKTVLILLREKGESPGELIAAVSVLRAYEHRVRVSLPYLVDTCGTGGDGQGTFNVSTIGAFVAAGAGAHVAKHGNRSVSSRVGSSDLLQALGANILAKPSRMVEALEKTGIAYFHAPRYHPILARVHPLRKSIRGRTIFNLLGPLLNPAGVRRQLIGVPDVRWLPVFGKVLKVLGQEHGFVVSGAGGTDEITPFGKTQGVEIRRGGFLKFVLDPQEFGFRGFRPADMKGGTLATNRRIALGILRNRIHGGKRAAVLLNAGLALVASGRAGRLGEGIELARESLNTDRAYESLKKFVEITRR
jgi:anthranilate phosphoribosyltransferase